jgi:release factor glutamine methyltransferase
VRKNANELNVDVDIRHGDLFKAVGKDTFDLIVSNPPYIPRGDLSMLQREVLREPMMALDGGTDGLEIYRRITAEAGAHLNPGGFLYLEVGIGEAEPVLALVTEHINCAQAGVFNDLNGIPRIVWARSV